MQFYDTLRILHRLKELESRGWKRPEKRKGVRGRPLHCVTDIALSGLQTGVGLDI